MGSEEKCGVLHGKYELGRLLGHGTFGKVYMARNAQTKKSVVGKEKVIRVGMMGEARDLGDEAQHRGGDGHQDQDLLRHGTHLRHRFYHSRGVPQGHRFRPQRLAGAPPPGRPPASRRPTWRRRLTSGRATSSSTRSSPASRTTTSRLCIRRSTTEATSDAHRGCRGIRAPGLASPRS